MSTKAYSTDLRTRVIEYIALGNSQRSASLLFKISTSAISKWCIRYKIDRSVIPKSRGGSTGKINVSDLQQFVLNNSDKTLSEIGLHFGASNCAIHKRLKALGFSYKKKPSPMWKQIRTKEIDT